MIPPRPITLGLTFSARYAAAFGLDAPSVYEQMLDDLQPRTVRLPIYWDEVEPTPDQFDFAALDASISTAAGHGSNVILVLGYKQPRWPECYRPNWAADLSADDLRARILNLVGAEVAHVRTFANITRWQVENEPLVHFGLCGAWDVLTPEFVAEEIALVRRLDQRPILLTDSGELSSWLPILQLPGDEFGATVYRNLWFPAYGSWQHPLPAWSYTAKDRLMRGLTGHAGPTIISEMQAEAWFDTAKLWEVSPLVQRRLFPPELVIDEHVDYARRTQFSEAYLWGVEWWYWMQVQGYPEYVDSARRAFLYHGRG